MSKAKKQATLPDELKDTTALADDLDTEKAFDHVGYRHKYRWSIHRVYPVKAGFAEPVKLSELEDGDNLVKPEHLKALNEAFTPLARLNRKRKARRTKLRAMVIMGSAFLLVTGVYVLGLNSESMDIPPGGEGLTWKVLFHFFMPQSSVLFGMAFISYIFRRMHRYADESEIENLPSTEFGEFKKIDGTPFDLGNPSPEELYKAAELLNELDESSKLFNVASHRLSDLRKSNASSGALEMQKEIRDKIRERITVIEREIEALLRNDTIMNETEESITQEGAS